MSADQSSLQALTNLLSEFHSPNLDPSKRSEIQDILLQFERTDAAFSCAVFYLRHTSDHFVIWYCLGIMEKFVSDRWSSISTDDRTEARDLIRRLLFQQSYFMESSFLLRKAAKILTIMAIHQLPSAYDDILTDLKAHLRESLNQSNLNGITGGLVILQTVIVDISMPPDSVHPQQKQELRSRLQQEVPNLFQLLIDVITYVCTSDLVTVWERSLSNPMDPMDEFFSSVRQLVSPTQGNDVATLRCNTILAWLECMSDCFRHLALETDFQFKFYSVLYALSVAGSPPVISAVVPTLLSAITQISQLALRCLMEVLEDRHPPTDFVHKHLSYIFFIGHVHLKLNRDGPHDASLDDYRTKLIHLLQVLISKYFVRMRHVNFTQQISTFNPEEFLMDLQHFTFSSVELEFYLPCLNIWSSYLESFQNSLNSTPNDVLNFKQFLYNTACIFGRHLYSKLFYHDSTTHSDLDKLTNDPIDDRLDLLNFVPEVTNEDAYFSIFFHNYQSFPIDEHIEREVFTHESFVLFKELMSFAPADLSQVVLEQYNRDWTKYVSVLGSSGILEGKKLLPQVITQIHRCSRDYATSLQAVGLSLEHLRLIASPVELLSSLVLGLQLCNRLVLDPYIVNECPVHSDLTDSIVQCLLSLDSIFAGGYLCVADDASSKGYQFDLSPAQARSFAMEILYHLRGLVFLPSDPCTIIPLPIRHSAAQLFKSICVCLAPVQNLCCSVSSTRKGEVHASESFCGLFDSICKPELRMALHPCVSRLLLHAYVHHFGSYLSSQSATNLADASSVQIKENFLNRCFTEVFAQYLSPDEMNYHPDRHLFHLGLLNDSINALESTSSSKVRNVFLSALVDHGILNSWVTCIELVLRSCKESPTPTGLRFCTAYLTIFTTYVRVFTHSTMAACSIPNLLSRTISTFCTLTTSTNFPHKKLLVDTFEHLLSIFLLVSKNRTVCCAIAEDLLSLCLFHILPSLSMNQVVRTNENQDLVSLVCDAATHDSPALERLYDLLFSLLLNAFTFFFKSNNDSLRNAQQPFQTSIEFHAAKSCRYSLEKTDAFHNVMRTIVAVFHEQQPVSSLVRFVLARLTTLNSVRKFYSLPAFSETWLPEILCLLLNRLLDRQHESCRDELLNGVFELSSCRMPPEPYSAVQDSTASFFTHRFLPAYLDSLQFLTPAQRTELVATFIGSSNGAPPASSSDLTSAPVFTEAIERLIVNLRYCRRTNLTTSNASTLF